MSLLALLTLGAYLPALVGSEVYSSSPYAAPSIKEGAIRCFLTAAAIVLVGPLVLRMVDRLFPVPPKNSNRSKNERSEAESDRETPE